LAREGRGKHGQDETQKKPILGRGKRRSKVGREWWTSEPDKLSGLGGAGVEQRG